jgi:hypothetical protein
VAALQRTLGSLDALSAPGLTTTIDGLPALLPTFAGP